MINVENRSDVSSGAVPATGLFPLANVLIIYLCFVCVRFAVSLLLEEPWIMNDELQYKTISYLLSQSKGLHEIFGTWGPDLADLNFVNILYPLLLTPSFYFGDNFHVVIKLINSLAMNSAAFPVYLTLKEFADHKRACWGTALVLLMPFFNFIGSVMAENLFFPLFLFCFYFAYKALVTLRPKYFIALTISLVTAYFTKPHIAPFIGTFVLVSFGAGLFLEHPRRPKARIWLFSLLTVLTCVVTVLMLNSFVIRSESVIGGYRGVLSWEYLKQVKFGQLFTLVISNISSFLFIYLLPLLVSFWTLLKAARERDNNKLIFLSLGLLSFVSMMAMAGIFAVQVGNYGKLNARLYFYLFPFFLISFLSFSESVSWTLSRKLALFFTFLAIMLVNLLVAYPTYAPLDRINFDVIYSNMDLSWLLLPPKKKIMILAYIACTMVVLYYLFPKRKAASPFVLYFVVLALAANVAEVTYAKVFNEALKGVMRPCRDLLKTVSLEGKVMLIDPGSASASNMAFWLNHDYSKTLREFPVGKVVTRGMVPADTQWLVLFGNYSLDFPTSSIRYTRNNCQAICMKGMNVTGMVGGMFNDRWTEKEFYYRPDTSFEKLVLSLSSFQPSYPNVLTVETDGVVKSFQLKDGVGEITLPFSKYYGFKLDHAFIPRERNMTAADNRELGVGIKSVYVY